MNRTTCAAAWKALDGRFEPYGEDYKKLAVPDDVPEDLRFLYVKKYFGFERNGTQADWALLHTRGMADVIAADLSRMAPLHQLMRQMRAQAEQAAQEAVARAGSECARRRAGQMRRSPQSWLFVPQTSLSFKGGRWGAAPSSGKRT